MKGLDFLRQAILALTGFVLLSGIAAEAKAGQTKQKNVLFIAVDDLNDWTGCLGGHVQAKTPNLDRLVARGTLFTNAHCAAPACNPSRAALMTGIRPSSSGVYYNNQPWRRSPRLKTAVTLPQHFRRQGYKALGSGKIYHGAFPDPQSWDQYWPSLKQQSPGDPMPKGRPLNGIPKTAHFDWGPVDASPDQMGDAQVADWVINQLGQTHDKPFFLACGFFRPHLPWYVPQKYFDAFPLESIVLPHVKENDHDDIPPAGRKMARTRDHQNVTEYRQWRQAVQGYLASIYFMDECLGRVIDALDQSQYAANTVVVLWSDHGWSLGEKLHWRKFALWEEATQNVLAFVAPGITPPGSRCEQPANLLDIYPTLLELCQLDPRPELEGRSLLPQLKDPRTKRTGPSLTTHGRANHSLRDTRWRYTRYADGSEELYDHSTDELEWTNLAGDPRYQAVKERLREWLPQQDAPESQRGKKSK